MLDVGIAISDYQAALNIRRPPRSLYRGKMLLAIRENRVRRMQIKSVETVQIFKASNLSQTQPVEKKDCKASDL